MRILLTADLHYNHPRGRGLAEDVIARMNQAGGDVLVVIGDTAAGDGDDLEQCLSRFRFEGPRLFVAGNHELWTRGPDSEVLWRESLPRRVTALGWQWLQTAPWIAPDRAVAIVGSIGWYDYTFAPDDLGIPSRFYRHKVSPGAARRLEAFKHLLEPADDIPAAAMEIVARWNDQRHVKLARSDSQFLDELETQLHGQLASLQDVPHLIAAIHHVPLAELLPPRHSATWDFVRAFLGSPRLGHLLLRYPNVRHLYCGHSHCRAEAHLGGVAAVNIGSGYRSKTFETLDL